MGLREARQRKVIVFGDVPVREVNPYGDEGGVTVGASGGECDSGGSQAPGDVINPSE